MIEGEEIFESAQETGYRLCRVGNGSSTALKNIFSASWDLNYPDRLWVCDQNGLLTVFNMKENTEDEFGVLFRRYTPIFENDASSEKRIHNHWDKMTTIPDRPDEVIFLLGVSQKVMYTALPPVEGNPYPSQPLLSSMARGDFEGFIFGSPVMEITAHQSRVTSMAASPAGHILATGDESGNVRFLLLRLLDEISMFKRNERKKKQGTSARHSSFLPTYNVIHRSHNGPVFALQWLPILGANSTTNDRNYALVTGSSDRSVRIWRVQCSTKTGISVSPAMILDTLSTHVLSLHTFLHIDRYIVAKLRKMDAISRSGNRRLTSRLRGNANSGSSLASSSHMSAALGLTVSVDAGGVGDESDNEEAELNLNPARSVFLSAGTNAGTVYVWKLPFSELYECIMGNATIDTKLSKLEQTLAGREIAKLPTTITDDGSKLYSLIQMSDRPVIHVSLSAVSTMDPTMSPLGKNGKRFTFGNSELSGSELLLVASDTQGCVRIYAPQKNFVDDPIARGAVEAAASQAPGGASSVISGLTGRTSLGSTVHQVPAVHEPTASIMEQSMYQHPLMQEYRKKVKSVNIREEGVGGVTISANNSFASAALVRVGEYTFNSPVVACCFPPSYPVSQEDGSIQGTSAYPPLSPTVKAGKIHGNEPASPMSVDGSVAYSTTSTAYSSTASRMFLQRQIAKWDPIQMQPSPVGPLVVGTSDGEVRLFSTDDLNALAYDGQKALQTVDPKNGSMARRSEGGGMSVAQSAYSASIAQALENAEREDEENDSEHDASVDGDVEAQSVHLKNRQRTKERRANRKNSMSSLGSTVTRVTNVTAAADKEQTRFETARKVDKNLVQSIETDAFPRSRPPAPVSKPQNPTNDIPPPPPPQPSAHSQGSVYSDRIDTKQNVKVANSFCAEKRPTQMNFKESQQLNVESHLKEKSPPISPLGTFSPRDTYHPPPVLAVPSVKVSTSLAKPLKAAAASEQRVQFGGQRGATPAADNTILTNNMAKPALSITKILEEKLNRLTSELDQDSFSVSTQKTTQSDRQAAQRASARIHEQGRYNALSSIRGVGEVGDWFAQAKAGRKSTLKGQRDSDWLRSRKFDGPTSEDLSALHLKDPIVEIALDCNVPDSTDKLGHQDRRFNREYGLRSTIDSSTLVPKFEFETNIVDVFGNFDPSSILSAHSEWTDRMHENLFGDVH